MSILTKKLRKKSKKPKEMVSREDFLQLKPVRNPLLKWDESRKKEVVIRVPLKVKKTKGKKSLSDSASVGERRVNLDKLGSFVWKICDGQRDMKEIIQEFRDEYKMTREEAEASISAFLQQLAKRGFIGVIVPEVKEGEKEISALREMKIS